LRAIQIILALGLVLIVILYFRRFQSRIFDRLSVLTLGLVGIVMVVMPEWTTALAHLVGVGRGADLVSYFGLVSLLFICLLVYSKLRSLESELTNLARAVAIEHAHRPPKPADARTTVSTRQDPTPELPVSGECR
jgi:hypothetical protein